MLKKVLSTREPGPPRLPKDDAFGIKPDTPVTLPSWFSEEDLSYYANKFNQKGFTGGLNYYRALDLYVTRKKISSNSCLLYGITSELLCFFSCLISLCLLQKLGADSTMD